jgi:uncharacterized repeat protein (TIGR03837 family)
LSEETALPFKITHSKDLKPSTKDRRPSGVWVWDVFCRVIDNHGDLGVCWRLSQALASQGHTVRLFVDHPEDLSWMAPHWANPHGHAPTLHGVSVWPWPSVAQDLHALPGPAQVVIEAFGCDLPVVYLTQLGERLLEEPRARWAWINVDYLSAEAFYQGIHRLPSPQLFGPALGLTKWFYQPGFTPASGGLLRAHRAALDPPDGTQAQSTTATKTATKTAPETETWVLFCYEPPALQELLIQLSRRPRSVLLHALLLATLICQRWLVAKPTSRPGCLSTTSHVAHTRPRSPHVHAHQQRQIQTTPTASHPKKSCKRLLLITNINMAKVNKEI